MAPPLIQLKDIALTFGGTPLLSGVELSVSPGERVCLIGRNGSGKSTLLKIAAGLVEPDSGSRFVQPGATIRYLPQEPDFAGHATTLAYVEAGLGPGDDHYAARYLLEQLGLHGDEDPRKPLRRRGPPHGAGARACALARYPAAGRADQPSRPDDHRMAGKRARQPPQRAGPDQPRSAFPLQSLALHRLARPRQDQADRPRLCRVRGLARRGAGGRRARAAQARPQNRQRGALAALRRLRPPQAQRQAARQSACAARSAAELSRRGRQRQSRRRGSGEIRQARDRGQEHREVLWRAPDRRSFLDPAAARRSRRHRRAERRRQDHAGQSF